MIQNILCTICFFVLFAFQVFSQEKWIPLLKQTKTAPTTTVSSSNNNSVSFNVEINGLSVSEQIIDSISYKKITIPDGGLMNIEGSPQLPVVTKLIAIPDCDNISISINPSGQSILSDCNIIPAPKYIKNDFSKGSHGFIETTIINKAVYSSSMSYPGKYGEIIETGYIRDQKVVRIAIYPVQCNPINKTASIYTNFTVTLSFINSKSVVNKGLGIFSNIVHHTALNYVVDNTSASTKSNLISQNISLSKASPNTVTSGSVTRVTDLSTIVGTSAISVDYLIVTNSSLFNSTYLTTLANHRRDYNGFDVAIVEIDGSGSSGIYNIQSGGSYKYPSTSTTRYVSIRDFVADVYTNGKASHTKDGHLAYLLLVGDAYDNSSIQMLPAAYPAYSNTDYNSVLDSAGDYYYSCLTQSGGIYDDLQDIMYGRLPVGTTTELSNAVSKIINYESNTNNNWQENYTFVSGSPDFWNANDSYYDYDLRTRVAVDVSTDHKIADMTNNLPSSVSKYYSYRNYDTDPATTVTASNTVYYPLTYTSAQYNSGAWCGWDLLNTWLLNKLNNNGIHTFIYEGHGGWNGLVANEGSGRRALYLDNANTSDPSNSYSINNLLRNNFNAFFILNCCDAGHFDNGDGVNWTSQTGDCISEYLMNVANYGAIGCIASTRDSYDFSFGYVDQGILTAQYNSLSQIMGEAVMESKLNMNTGSNRIDLLFRRQYNLYGDPALNLWPTGYTINQNMTLSGKNDILTNLTVRSGVTLTVSPGATLNFASGAALIVNGTLIANGTSSNPITFNFNCDSGMLFSGSSCSASLLNNIVVCNDYSPVASGRGIIIGTDATITIQPYATIAFRGGASLSVNGILNIRPATTLNFYSAPPVIVSGQLNAIGSASDPVTFNFNGGGSGGIHLSGLSSSSSSLQYIVVNNSNCEGINISNGSSASFENSILNNCGAGVYIYNASPMVLANQILGSIEGIYIDASNCQPYIQGNLIKHNNGYVYGHGIAAYNNSLPLIANNRISGYNFGIYSNGTSISRFYAPAWVTINPNNLVTGNWAGLAVSSGGAIWGGDSYATGCYNSIHDNYCDAYFEGSGTIYAEYNYWGSNPSFFTNGNSTFDRANALTADPWNNTIPFINTQGKNPNKEIAASIKATNINSSDSTLTGFFSGFNLEMKGDINGAVAKFLSLIMKGDPKSDLAITELFGIMKQYPRSDISTFISSFSASNKYFPLISKLMADKNLQNGQFDEAISTYDNLNKKYPKEYIGINAKFQKLFAYINIKHDKINANNILTEIKNLNLTDHIWTSQVQMAEILINGLASINKNQTIEESSNAASENIPKEYALSNNYPNPFNPITRIEYQIPKGGFVTLKVFDLLGRIVKTLVNENKTAGKYSVNFDGSNLASGVYIYQIKVNSGGNNNFVASKKMQLIK